MAIFIDRDALVRDGTVVPSSLAQVSKRAVWASAKISTTRRGKRGQSISVDDSADGLFAALVAAVNPAVATSVNRHFVPMAEDAFEHWPAPPPGPPKRTGLSKSLLGLEVSTSPDGGELTASMVSGAPYTVFIQRGLVARSLIWAPGAMAADAMADEIGKELAE